MAAQVAGAELATQGPPPRAGVFADVTWEDLHRIASRCKTSRSLREKPPPLPSPPLPAAAKRRLEPTLLGYLDEATPESVSADDDDADVLASFRQRIADSVLEGESDDKLLEAIASGRALPSRWTSEDESHLRRILAKRQAHHSGVDDADFSDDDAEFEGVRSNDGGRSAPGKASGKSRSRRELSPVVKHRRRVPRRAAKSAAAAASAAAQDQDSEACHIAEYPFADNSFDSPPPSPIGIELRAGDYHPPFFYFGAASKGKRRRGTSGFVDVPANFDSETEAEDIADRSVCVVLHGKQYYVPQDKTLFAGIRTRHDGFDIPLSLAEIESAEDEAVDFEDASARELLAPTQPASERSSTPLRDTSENRERTARTRDRQRKRIWSLMIKKEMPREHRKLHARSLASVNHFRRISFIVVKEVRKNAQKTQRGMREAPTRARRLVREMQAYWRRVEKDLMERRKAEEKEELDRIRIEDESREAERQQRKLEFLLTQTELFSHFIGAKMGIIPADKSAEDVSRSCEAPPAPESGTQELAPQVDENAEKLKAEAAEATKKHIQATLESARKFDEAAGIRKHTPAALTSSSAFDADEVDLLNPSTMPAESLVSEPSLFHGKLKEYQLKGLNWLVNLYEQGINGILADEMGLGKTIQSICFLAYLADVKKIWGPFVIIAPNSTLHQWKQELNKFAPDLKVIPYWGTQKDRAIIRKFWKPKLLGQRDAPFHVCVTSYSVLVNDEKHFQRIKWQYMVLDEAQAIKNASSQRWNKLLGLKCRNRLLLTGTPIQNSMAELWALLHFIMPTLFDSHDEFNEWFSKDIESHATGDKNSLDSHQIKRLHMILKPFMLRRVKRDVEHEMAEKIEIQVNCALSRRQRVLYKALRDRVSFADLGDPNLSSKENLMNLVVQFRKVCNHPEIFERSSAVSPFHFVDLALASTSGAWASKRGVAPSDVDESLFNVSHNPIQFRIGRSVQLECFSQEFRCPQIWHPSYIQAETLGGSFSFSRFIDTSPSELSYCFLSGLSPVHQWMAVLTQRHRARRFDNFAEVERAYVVEQKDALGFVKPKQTRIPASIQGMLLIAKPSRACETVAQVVHAQVRQLIRSLPHLRVPFDRVSSPPIEGVFSCRRDEIRHQELLHCGWERSVLIGSDCMRHCGGRSPHLYRGQLALPTSVYVPSTFQEVHVPEAFVGEDMGTEVLPGLCVDHFEVVGANSAQVFVPHFGKLIADSGKMMVLDSLLRRLKSEGHRVLIFSQMRKMIDVLEDYMQYRKYRMFRLDGTTDLADRRDMVNEFQSNDDVFAFLLSTRAGGLGITLTAADTVIFYDNDWNPTMDAQAMDRVHRIGQTKQVTVYRMVCRGTVEERILKRAQAKFEIQKTVYAGGFKLQSDVNLFQRNELKEFLLEDEQ